jgi:hypothetical protein
MSQQQKGKGGGWGSLLSGAVAGIESRLDNILADDDTRVSEEAARKARLAAQGKTATSTLKAEDRELSRASSKSRANDRLAERLAKAAKGEKSSRPSSELPSRTASPLPMASKEIARPSSDAKAEEDEDGEGNDEELAEVVTRKSNERSARTSTEATAAASPSLNDSKASSIRRSEDSVRLSRDSIPPVEVVASIPLKRSPSFLETEVTRLTEVQEESTRNYQEELHAHLERIDALQAKLEYLAKQASTTAREAASSADSGSLEKKLAEQEERNALLLEEGNKLSKNEIKARGAIMKLRQRVQDEEKSKSDLRRRLATSEDARSDLSDRLRIVEEREKAAQARLKSLTKLEVELDTARREGNESRRDTIVLRKQLAEAEKWAEEAEKRAQTDKVEEQMRAIAELSDDVDNARLEKRLVEDRAKAEIKQLKEDAARKQEKSQLAELELRNEIQVGPFTDAGDPIIC